MTCSKKKNICPVPVRKMSLREADKKSKEIPVFKTAEKLPEKAEDKVLKTKSKTHGDYELTIKNIPTGKLPKKIFESIRKIDGRVFGTLVVMYGTINIWLKQDGANGHLAERI